MVIYYKYKIAKCCAYSSELGENMKPFTVTLFGHRRIDDLQQLNEQLSPIIREWIQTKPYIVFLIGRSGEFDEYVASVIKQAQKELGKENSDLILVLPYSVADIDYYERYYDQIIIPESVYGVHPKSAITLKNKWMIDRSDLVIVYAERDTGGAYTALKYAEKQNKRVINLCTNKVVGLYKKADVLK